VAMCNPSWKQGKSQGRNEMKKKRRIGKEKFEKNEKNGRRSKKKWRSKKEENISFTYYDI